ncbi:hypothetical protein DYB37_000947 [Aphanomyces astaci]|uniref:Dynein heavy chain linker domain-containing protein n=1 Tax=Aphanomyces astaci TaxID=112090 RepID=A0A3R6YKQ3_APHAT|nr:hypothetical protein DYB37_000947 [Aphanomyces astaci]
MFVMVIDTPDKLLAYCLHVIAANERVVPSHIRLKDIRTVADAVFAPARKPLEIHYLDYNPSPPCHFTNVYWLSPVPVSKLDLKRHYFTLTSYGLTHVAGVDTEVYDVATWLTEKAIFDQIVQMPCIQLMRKMTTFHTWKQNSIGIRFGRARKHLTQKLIWCQAGVVPYALQIRHMTLQVGCGCCDQLHPYWACHLAMSSIVQQAAPVAFEETRQLDYTRQVTDVLAAVDKVEAFIYEALAPLLQDHARYGSFAASSDVIPIFVRVVDYMVVEALFDAVTTSMDQLVQAITGVTSNSTEYDPQIYDFMDPNHRTGTVAYKRLFQLQSASRAPDPLFFVHITIHDTTHCAIASPSKEAWLGKLHASLSQYVAAVDSIGRVGAIPRVRQFVHDHCRPYFRHYFANNLHRFSAMVHNHAHVANVMTALRTAMDIYFAEIEHLASTCLPLKAEFRQLQTIAVPMASTTTPSPNVDTVAYVAEVCGVMQSYVAFRRELRIVDSVLQVGCFLVDRSNFVGNMLHECNATLLTMYEALPHLCKRFMAAVSDELAHKASTLASIPESVDEVDTYRFKMKALVETSSRIVDANQPFYVDLFSRTMSTRRDILALEFDTVATKLDHALTTFCMFDAFPHSGGFGGPDVQALLQVVRHLVNQSARLLTLEAHLEAFRGSSNSYRLQRRRHSFRQMSIDHVYKQHDRLDAVVVLLGLVQSYVELRAPTNDVPLVGIDLPALLAKIATLKRQSQPYCAMLGGVAHPLVAQFYPSIQSLHDAVEIAVTMSHVQFTASRWCRLATFFEHAGAATCTLRHIEHALKSPDAALILTELTDAVRVEARIKDTIGRVKAIVADLTFEFKPDARHDLRVTNCLTLTSSLEDAHLSLMSIRHHKNPWLRDVERLEIRILDAIALLEKVHDMEQHWSKVSSAVAVPEVLAHLNDASLQTAVEAMGTTWRDCLLAVYRWDDHGKKTNVMIKLETVFNEVDFPQWLGLCERIRASMESYMEALRASFARLHLLSNDDLLTLLQTPTPVDLAVQWCYPGVQTVHVANTTQLQSSAHIAGLMDADFMSWLLGDHAISYLHAVSFHCHTDMTQSWVLNLYRPVKILGSLSFWLGQLDIILTHSLASNVMRAKATTYDPVSSMVSDQEALPPQLALSLLHVQFCTLVGRVIEPSPKRLSSARTVLATTATAHRTSLTKLIGAMRSANECNVAVEDAIVLMAYEDGVVRRLTTLAGTHDWAHVVHEWEVSFQLAEVPSSADSTCTSSVLQAQMGHVVVPCGLDIQPKTPWIVILPETERCMFALFHAMRLSVCPMMFGAASTGKRTLIQGVGYLLMRCQWHVHCDASTPLRQLTGFVAGMSAVHGWGFLDNVFQLPVTLLGVLMAEMNKLQHSHVLQVASSGAMTCAIIMSYKGSTLTDSAAVKWLGAPLRPVAVPPPNLALAFHVLLASKGFSNEVAIRNAYSILATLFASSPQGNNNTSVLFLSLRFLRRVASMAGAITKQVAYVIHSQSSSKGSHVRHDASPLNTARYQDSNVFRFALLLVLEPLGLFPRGHVEAVVDQFAPSTMVLTQENRMVASAFKVVLERSHFVPIPSLVQKGVELHQALEVHNILHFVYFSLLDMQLLESLLGTTSNHNISESATMHLTVVPLDELTTPSTALSILSDVVHAKRDVKFNCVCFDGMLPTSGVVFDYMSSILDSNRAAATRRFPHGRQDGMNKGNPMVVLEVVSLASISPAMLTDCTVVCMDTVVITWQHLLEKWVHQQPSKDHPAFALIPCMQDNVHRFVIEFALPFQATMSKYPMTLLMANILHLVAAIYDAMLPSVTELFLEQCTFLAVMWGLGSYLSTAHRGRLQAFVQELVNEQRQTTPWPSVDALFLFCLEHNCSFFDMTVDLDENRIARVSSPLASPYWGPGPPQSTMNYVPTPPLQFASGLFSMLQSRGVSMVVTGPRGSGKSTALHHLASLVAEPRVFLHSPSQSQHALLKRWMLTANAGAAFVDNVGLDDPRVFRLCRNAVGSQRLFDSNRGSWVHVKATVCGSVGDAQLDQLSDHERLRFLRHFYVVRLTEPSPDELVSMFAHSSQRTLSRSLHPDELGIVQRTISTLQRVRQHLPLRPQYHFGECLIQHILQATLIPSRQPEDLTWTWLLNVKAYVWDALATDAHRQIVQNALRTVGGSGDDSRAAAVDFDDMVWSSPWVASVISRPPAAKSRDKMHVSVRAFMEAEYLRQSCVYGKVDLGWLRAMNAASIVHWIQLNDAFHSHKQVVVVGHDRHCHDNTTKLIAHLAHVKYVTCDDVTSQAGLVKLLDTLCHVTVMADEKVIFCLHDDAFTKWPDLWSFALDLFRGHITTVAQTFVAHHPSFVPSSEDSSGHHLVQDFMQRMRANLCCLVHFQADQTSSPHHHHHLDALLTHRNIPTTVISLPPPSTPSSSQDHADSTQGFIRHVVDQHKQLALSDSDCATLAHACADIHATVCTAHFFTSSSTTSCPGIVNLLQTFSHLLDLRAGATFGHSENGGVREAVAVLEDVRRSFRQAQADSAHWDAAHESCRARQAAWKKLSFAVESKASTNTTMIQDVEHRALPLLQHQLDDVLAALEGAERQRRIDRKALEHAVMGSMTAADKQSLLDKSFQPLVRMTTALCVAFETPGITAEAACKLMEDPAFETKLIALDIPGHVVATGELQHAMAFALTDVAVMHTKQPMFAAVVRWLHFKLTNAIALDAIAGLRVKHAQITEEMDTLNGMLAQLRMDAADLATHKDTLRILREELSMEATEAKLNSNVAKRDTARLSPLQSFIDFYLTWLRAKYWVHAPTSLTSLLYLAGVVTYAGTIPPMAHQELTSVLAATLTCHGFVLPRDVAWISDTTASLVSTLEADVCFANHHGEDKSILRDLVLLADWSHQTPLFVDPLGVVEPALVEFLDRLKVPMPDARHIVVSCLDPNMLDKLQSALLTNTLVMVRHFSMAKFDLLRPFLHRPRVPLMHQLLVKHSKRPAILPRHHSTVTSLAPLASDSNFLPPKTTNSKGTFQLYLISDEAVVLSAHERSFVNVLDCSTFNVQPVLCDQLNLLLNSTTTENNQSIDLARLQTFVDMHYHLGKLLIEIQHTPTQAQAIQSILQYDHHRQSLETNLAPLLDKTVSSSNVEVGGHEESQDDLVASSAAFIGHMLHALHLLGPAATNSMHSIPRFRKLLIAIHHDRRHEKADPPAKRMARLIECLHLMVVCSLPPQCRRLFDCLVAVQQEANAKAPALDRVLTFLAGSDVGVPSPTSKLRPQRTTRASVQSPSQGHIHRLRRIHSVIATVTSSTESADSSTTNEDEISRQGNVPHRQWMAHWNSVEMYAQLQTLEALVSEWEGISQHIRLHTSLWQTYIVQALQASPPHFVVPHSWPTPMSAFHRMLLLRCICPDMLAFHMDLFIEDVLSPHLNASRTPPHLVLSPVVVVVADNQSDLMSSALGDTINLNFQQRYIFGATSAPLFTAALDSVLAKGGSLVVDLLRASDFGDFYRIFHFRSTKSHTSGFSHVIVLVCAPDVAAALPIGFVQTTQTITLPLDLPATGHDHLASRHMDAHSVVAAFGRSLLDVQHELAAWNAWHAVGWRDFDFRPSHLDDMMATLKHLGVSKGACEPTTALALTKQITAAIQDGVLGAGMAHDHDRHHLVTRFVTKWITKSSDYRRHYGIAPASSKKQQYAQTDDAIECGVAPRMATFVRNVLVRTESTSVINLCRSISPPSPPNDSDEHAVAVCRHMFRSFLHTHHVHHQNNSQHTHGQHDDATMLGAMLVTVAALKFRRSVTKIHHHPHVGTKDTSIALALLQDDLAQRNTLWLHCLEQLDLPEPSPDARRLLLSYHLPPDWMGLPTSATPVPLAALAIHLNRTSDFFRGLKGNIPSVVPLDCLHCPDQFLAGLMLHNAKCLGCDINQLHLELEDGGSPTGGSLVSDTDGLLRAVVVSGLWLFDGHDNRPLFDKLPPLTLRVSLKAPSHQPASERGAVQLPWYALWSLEHVGVWRFGDSRVFRPLGPPLWYTSSDPLPRPETAVLLCPAIDALPSSVSLLLSSIQPNVHA